MSRSGSPPAASAASCCRSIRREVLADAKAALTFKLAHDDLSHYNAVQKVLYAGVILCGVLIVLSGLSIWKPVQFQELTALFGGYDFARYVHFFAMAAIVGFLVRACGAGAAGAEEPARHDHGEIAPCASARSFPASIPSC